MQVRAHVHRHTHIEPYQSAVGANGAVRVRAVQRQDGVEDARGHQQLALERGHLHKVGHEVVMRQLDALGLA
jgi:hypothetical protein